MKIAVLFHILGITVWVGGMFFAYVALRPAAVTLEPPQRLRLWRDTLRGFFSWVWGSVALILASGLAMLSMLGGMRVAGVHVHAMLAIGLVMVGIFGHVYFAPFKRLNAFVEAADWKQAGAALAAIRKLVALNLTLGLITIAIATAGSVLR